MEFSWQERSIIRAGLRELLTVLDTSMCFSSEEMARREVQIERAEMLYQRFVDEEK
jgi:hypothetical protein